MADLERALPGIQAPPRPKRSDPKILRQAAEMLAPAIVRWANDPAVTLESVVADLVKVLTPYNDGYDIARELENNARFSPDASLVEILERADSYIRRAHQDAVKAWVKANEIQLQFPIGAEVSTRKGPGLIVVRRVDTAEYIVATTEKQRQENGGWVLDAEDVTALPVEATGAVVAHA